MLIWVPDSQLTPKLPVVQSIQLAAQPLTPEDADGIQRPGTWYMFYETLSTLSWNGDIGWAWSRDGITWRHGGIALDEPFHLSFPFTFRWGDQFYFMPETHGNDSISLYVATDFPSTWKLAKYYFTNTGSRFGATLVDHISLHVPPDRSLDGTDTVFMYSYLAGLDSFMIFYMDASMFPMGDWSVHPMAPITAMKATGKPLDDKSQVR